MYELALFEGHRYADIESVAMDMITALELENRE